MYFWLNLLTESTISILNIYQHSKHGSRYLAILCLLVSVDMWADNKESDLEGKNFKTLLIGIDVNRKQI